jgi:outer membrane protein assembly factor BamD (BamD/ComL family)
MVQQELDVGRYYMERSREYPSAIFCFENVIRQKDVNPQAAAEAKTLLEKTKQLMNTAKAS